MLAIEDKIIGEVNSMNRMLQGIIQSNGVEKIMEKQEEVSTFPEDEQMTESKYRLVKNSKLAKKASWKRIAPAQMTAQRKEESYIRKRKSLEDEAENCGA